MLTTKQFVPLLLLRVPKLFILLMIVLLTGAGFQLYQWYGAYQMNKAFDNQSIVKHRLDPHNHLHAYSVGYLQAHLGKPQLAAKAYTLAEAADDIHIRSRAKYALGNLYFDLSLSAANIAAGGAHQQAVAQIELAREAYKGALRLQPNMYAARYNLELLDRLSPEKRTQGWQAETDGVTLQPFKRNGTAMMKDNTRRGLP